MIEAQSFNLCHSSGSKAGDRIVGGVKEWYPLNIQFLCVGAIYFAIKSVSRKTLRLLWGITSKLDALGATKLFRLNFHVE